MTNDVENVSNTVAQSLGSLISGVLNSCTYVGSALSTYGLALVTDAFGWDATVGIWCIAALIGTLCCILNVGRWKRYVDSI